ncbi:hypothetical protein FACS189452_10370 [Bacteroidia bacterium]|nr:hypothetical protein FACS189452_10370 [Bacteroidia bacterium]GHT82963.1 hypothetical protein FACS189467_8390 [Bacteroidia bacterium]
MNVEEIWQYCTGKPSVEECFPFDEDALVFKVGGKMFALMSLQEKWLNLKCDPALALELRATHDAVIAGWHMNKKHWNTILLDHNVAAPLLRQWIDHSYELVVKSLPQKMQLTINNE